MWEFARWLPDFNWQVSVLTAGTRAYPEISEGDVELPHEDSTLSRAFALDAKRHLSIFGRYLRATEVPDRWSTWIAGGVICGIRQILRDRPDVIYTTYPIVSSHFIGSILHRIFGIPWVAEFRDPMVEENFPPEGAERNLRLRLERRIFKSTRKLVLVTPSARDYYEKRSGREPGYAVEIANGINESLLQWAQEEGDRGQTGRSGKVTLLHSGVLYDEVRDPRDLMTAIRDLKAKGVLDSDGIEFVFRGSGNEAEYSRLVRELDIDDLVQFRESVPYRQAFCEMREADALMVLQGGRCNRQIPAKLYECCALQKPILCLADPEGDTGRVFDSLGLGRSVALENSAAIKSHIPRFLEDVRSDNSKVLGSSAISALSRRSRAKELAILLDDVRVEARAS